MSVAGKLQIRRPHRDNLFAALGADDIRPVRQVAIDDTWSGLRFRPA